MLITRKFLNCKVDWATPTGREFDSFHVSSRKVAGLSVAFVEKQDISWQEYLNIDWMSIK